MASTSIRVSTQTRDALKSLAERRGATADEMVAELVAGANEDAMLDAVAEDFGRIAADPATAAAYRHEADLGEFENELPEW